MKKPSGRSKNRLPPGVVIHYEDAHILIVEKPHGLLTIATERGTQTTLYSKLTEYVRKGIAKSRNRIFVVHRLDRDASGVLVFAKTFDAKAALQAGWEHAQKRYVAVVHGRMPESSGVIESYLIENKAQIVRSTKDEKRGKLSRTAYRVIEATGGRSALDIDLITGRKHQIRVHLAELGRPIVGDKKYGTGKDGERRLALHAKSLAFEHPATRHRVEFDIETPEFFKRLMRVHDVPGHTNTAGRPRP